MLQLMFDGILHGIGVIILRIGILGDRIIGTTIMGITRIGIHIITDAITVGVIIVLHCIEIIITAEIEYTHLQLEAIETLVDIIKPTQDQKQEKTGLPSLLVETKTARVQLILLQEIQVILIPQTEQITTQLDHLLDHLPDRQLDPRPIQILDLPQGLQLITILDQQLDQPTIQDLRPDRQQNRQLDLQLDPLLKTTQGQLKIHRSNIVV